MDLIGRLLAGDARAAGRAMSLVADGAPEALDVLRGIASHTGRAYCVGFTGPPGVGKSALLAVLTLAARRRGRSVGIVAADPTSAFTGGALLGDRIRMRKLFEDPQVFIRSMATREHPGSLPPAARDVCRILDAMGKDLIFVETVGAGQGDIAVVRHVDSVVLVLSPGTGDYVQAMKAGSMEVADIIVVNKADLPGAEEALADVTGFLHLRAGRRRATEECASSDAHPYARGGSASEDAESSPAAGQRPQERASPEVPVVATRTLGEGDGIDMLLDEIDRHARYLRESGELDRRRRGRLRQEIADHCVARVAECAFAEDRLEAYVGQVADGRLTASEAGRRLAGDLLKTAATTPGRDDHGR